MNTIEEVVALQILDSRGKPTVEVSIVVDGQRSYASVPSGASTGTLEASELRDSTAKPYHGQGVSTAVANVNQTIANHITNKKYQGQQELDQDLIQLDGSENKANLGANAILAVSLAYAKACAALQQQHLYQYLSNGPISLPRPMLNLINGGAHANNNLQIQEFMIIPQSTSSMALVLQQSAEVFYTLKKLIADMGHPTTVGDEGGFAPGLNSSKEAIELLLSAIDKAGYSAPQDFTIALDCASTEFYQEGKYHLENNHTLSPSKFCAYLGELIEQYPISSIEDGMAEDDLQGWKELTDQYGSQVQLVGDDLFVTNAKILQQGIDKNIANAILIKLNQIGTLTETLDTIALAKKHQYATIVSHRSGETASSFISDLATATDSGQIKTGSLSRSERTVKYNRLLWIEYYQQQARDPISIRDA